jgi:hypothetical protein
MNDWMSVVEVADEGFVVLVLIHNVEKYGISISTVHMECSTMTLNPFIRYYGAVGFTQFLCPFVWMHVVLK